MHKYLILAALLVGAVACSSKDENGRSGYGGMFGDVSLIELTVMSTAATSGGSSERATGRERIDDGFHYFRENYDELRQQVAAHGAGEQWQALTNMLDVDDAAGLLRAVRTNYASIFGNDRNKSAGYDVLIGLAPQYRSRVHRRR